MNSENQHSGRLNKITIFNGWWVGLVSGVAAFAAINVGTFFLSLVIPNSRILGDMVPFTIITYIIVSVILATKFALFVATKFFQQVYSSDRLKSVRGSFRLALLVVLGSSFVIGMSVLTL